MRLPVDHATYLDLDGTSSLCEDDLSRLLDRLPEARREKTLALRFARDRASSACAWALLAHAARAGFGIEANELALALGPHGKPRFVDGDGMPDVTLPHFNLSHTRGAAMCVVATSPVGCDAQSYAELPLLDEALEAHVLHPNELCLVSPLAHEERRRAFALLWAAKEAYTKQRGVGFTVDVRRFDFSRGVGDFLAARCPEGEGANDFAFSSHGLGFVIYDRNEVAYCACSENPLSRGRVSWDDILAPGAKG